VIRARLRLLSWSSMAIVVLAMAMAAVGYHRVQREKSAYDQLRLVRESLVSLNVLTLDLLYDTKVALQPGQWRLVYGKMARLLSEASAAATADERMLVSLHRKLGERMERFLGAREKCLRNGKGSGRPPRCRELMERLATQVRLVLQDLFTESSVLERRAAARMDRYFYLGIALLLVLLAGLSLMTVALLWPTARRLEKGLGKLMEATARISGGDLAHRVNLKGGDELARLAETFNAMMERRRVAEEELRRSEASLVEAQQVARLGSWELDLVENRLWWSAEIFRIFEIDPHEFGASYEAFLERVHPEDRTKVDEAYRRSVEKKEPYEIIHRLLLGDGRIRYVHERGRTHYAEDGTPLRSIGTAQDVTERHLAYRALEENERELDAIIESLPLMVFLKDAETLRFVRFNHAGEALLGISREKILGSTDHDLFPKEQADVFVREDRRVLESCKVLDVALEPVDTVHGRRFLHTRKVCICDREGKPRYLLGISEDITQQVEAERRVRYRLSLETATAQVSMQLAQADASSLEEILEQTLERIGQAMGADRGYLLQIDAHGDSFTTAHEWYSPGVTSRRESLEDVAVAPFASLFERFGRDEVVAVHDAAEVTGCCPALGRFMKESGIGSLVNVPVRVESELVGVLGFASVEGKRWPEEDVQLLRIVAESVAATLSRLRTAEAMREHTWYLEGMDRISSVMAEHALQEEMLDRIAALVLELFQADRAWMLEAARDGDGFEVPIEHTRPEYPGAVATGLKLPDDDFGREMMARLLRSGEPLVMQMEELEGLPDYLQGYQIRSQMLIAIQPALGPPWVLGIHQCSHERHWSAVEKRLFRAIAERVAVALVGVRLLEEVQQSEKRLQESQKIAQVGTWELDLRSGRAYWSEQEYRCLGYEPGACEPGYDAFARAVHPEDLPAVEVAMQRAIESDDGAYEIRHRVVWPDGTEHVVDELGVVHRDADGSAMRMIGTTQDVTGRIRLERELERHRLHLERLVRERTRTLRRQAQIIEQTNDSVVTTDMEGRVTSWNGGAVRVFGYSEEEAMGRHIAFVYPEGHDEVLRDRVVRPLLEKGRHETEVVLERKSGESFPAFLSLSLLYDEKGAPDGMVGYAVDISELKKREEELRRLAERLEASNRELESFSYSVSHDLRAPLRAIDGFSQALVEDYAERLDGVALDYLGRIRNGAQRLGVLIDDLLELSRVNRGELQLETVDLTAMARSVLAELRAGDPERQVEVELDPGMNAIGDPRLLRVVVANLLGNAWKFTSKESEPRIRFGVKEGAEGTFYVRDNGVGFDMRHAGKLFGAFQRLHRASEFPGTGVGLATVQRIVHRHGGRVWAEAEPGKGAVFYFSLEPAGAGEES